VIRRAALLLFLSGAFASGPERPAAAAGFEVALGVPPRGTYDVRVIETVEEGGETRRTIVTAPAHPPLDPHGGWRFGAVSAERRFETPRGPVTQPVAAPGFGVLADALLRANPPRRVADGTAVYAIPLAALAGEGAEGKSIALTPVQAALRDGRRELDTAARGRITVNMMGLELTVDYCASVSVDIETGVPVRGELSWHGEQAGNRLFSRREIVMFSRY
jgi:hypothetical protein